MIRVPHSGVRVARDRHGIPHIDADRLEDAFWGLGYCHAMDRALPMVLLRILGRGEAAKRLDGSDEMVELDRFFRRMNWVAEESDLDDELDPSMTAVVEAYCAGVTARLTKLRRCGW